MTAPHLRDAATIILIRDIDTTPRILMGQRGAKAVFMPNKMVFPGGAVDPGDADVLVTLDPLTEARLAERSDCAPHALAAAALRELMEETGQLIGTPGPCDLPGWEGYAEAGLTPDASALTYIFRATTPPGRPRRFDARFFLADAGSLSTDPDDFSRASGELSHLRWVDVAEAKTLDLPFITEVVLAEVAAMTRVEAPATIPFFENRDEESLFHRLGGRSPLDR